MAENLAVMEEEVRRREEERYRQGTRRVQAKGREDADADYEEETGECRAKGKGREHPWQVRAKTCELLALGLAPSQVVPTLGIAGFEFTEGKVPKLRWVRAMRKELRVMCAILAAATAADPQV